MYFSNYITQVKIKNCVKYILSVAAFFDIMNDF
jgi:hypothetical protein